MGPSHRGRLPHHVRARRPNRERASGASSWGASLRASPRGVCLGRSGQVRRARVREELAFGPAGTSSPRSIIESNAVALLSNRHKPPIDPPSPNWLGLYAQRAEIRESGLWNVNYVDQPYDPAFIELLDSFVAAMS